MVMLIALKDFLERQRDGRLYWAGGVVLLLLLSALAVGFSRQQEVRAEQKVAQTLDYKDWLSQDRRHPHDAAHQGMHAFKPDAALAIVDPGINPYIGGTIWLQAHRQSEVKFRPAQDATGLQRFGDLSAGWIMQVLGPLLVIVLGFNTFAGEREQGILRQTLSLGVSPLQLLWGKAMALAMGLAALLVPAALAAAIAVGLGAESGTTSDALMRFGAMAVGYALYLGIFVFLVLGVSAAASTSRVAITVLLALWIANTVIAPRVLSELSRVWQPSPTKLEFTKELNAGLKAEADRVWQQAFGTTDRWSRDVPLSQWGRALQLDDKASYAIYDHHYGKLWDTYERQQKLQEWSGLVFPLLAVRAWSMGLAGTDFVHHRNFTTAAEQHRRVVQDLMSDDLVASADPLGNQHFQYQAGPDLWAKVPAFHYHPPSAGWALRSNWTSLAVLIASLLLALGFAWAAVARQRAL
ncbi:MAG: ABC transporter permease subunit [Polaromonas sp.]|uniref:ABC transporter permease subunit n=1 Tax=Polaromonas sp. TaxID=1869339 RepID=UPI00179ACFAD|nr:ABC transporter permease subunit [Polaromonas sp.]MBA3595140.1 ABC transporter permease subunit [Polaromonas sp.]